MQALYLVRQSARAAALVAGIGLTGWVAAPAHAEDSASLVNQFPAHTAPVEKREQNFDIPGVVEKVLVKEGDAVKAGQLIAQEDTDADEAHLKSAELVANSDLEVQAEDAQLAKDQVDLQRKAELFKQNATDPSTYDEAKLAVTIDQFKAAHAREDKTKASYDVAEGKAKIHEKQMFARIDGVVSEIATHEGELASTQHPAITIVENDVLYVEVDLPADVVNRLKASGMKAPLQVRYVDEGEKGVWREASVHFIKPEADAQSNFEHVQLKMPNPELRSAGLQVLVKLPENLVTPRSGGAAARVLDGK